jgi:hypothetical protein
MRWDTYEIHILFKIAENSMGPARDASKSQLYDAFAVRSAPPSGIVIAGCPAPQFPKNRIGRYVASYLTSGKQHLSGPGE